MHTLWSLLATLKLVSKAQYEYPCGYEAGYLPFSSWLCMSDTISICQERLLYCIRVHRWERAWVLLFLACCPLVDVYCATGLTFDEVRLPQFALCTGAYGHQQNLHTTIPAFQRFLLQRVSGTRKHQYSIQNLMILAQSMILRFLVVILLRFSRRELMFLVQPYDDHPFLLKL